MDAEKKDRSVVFWIGWGFIGFSILFLSIEMLQGLGIIEGWLDDPLTGAIAVGIVGTTLIMLEENKKKKNSEASQLDD